MLCSVLIFAFCVLFGVFVELEKCSANLVLNSLNCDEAMFGVQKSSLNMFWEYSPSSTNIGSDWLRAKSSPVDEEEIKMKMDDGVDTSLASEGFDLFVHMWEAQPCLWDPDPVRDDENILS